MSYSYHGQYPENYSTPTTPHAYQQWELDQSQQQQDLHLQPPPTHQAQLYPSNPPTIQLEEPERIVPSQSRENIDDISVRLHPVPLSHEGRSDTSVTSGDAKPRIHVDTTRHSVSPAGSISTMVVRRSPTATRPHHQLHPYRRPQSAAGGPSATGARPRREPEQHVRFAGQSSGSVMPSPASAPSRVTTFGPLTPSASSPVVGIATETGMSRYEQSHSRRYTIRSDIHYDGESKVLTAMLELPGVKKADMSVKLSTSTWNQVKQVTVSGRTKPIFPEGSLAVRERKFGEFTRTLAVCAETKPEDIDARLEDGVLVLKIACGPPAEPEEPLDIPIR